MALAFAAITLASGCGSSRTASESVVVYSNGLDIELLDVTSGARTTLIWGRAADPDDYEDFGVEFVEPVWSPDARRIAYVKEGQRASIWVVEPSSHRRWRVSPRLIDQYSTTSGLRWSPDGAWIAFRAKAGIWVARADGSASRRVFHVGARDETATGTLGWTQDGRLVLRDHGKRFVVQPAHGAPRPFRGPLDARAEGLSVSRDAHGDDQVLLHGRAMTANRSLPGHVPVQVQAPRLSPDGRWVAFDRNDAVVVVNVHGGGERRLLADAAIASWSPNGRYLLVRSRLGWKPLFAFDVATGRPKLVASSAVRRRYLYEHQGASWRPAPAPAPAASARTPATPPKPHAVDTGFTGGAFARGHARIVDGRRIYVPDRAEVTDVSPNGRLAALWIYTGRSTARVAVLNLATGTLRPVGRGASPGWRDLPSFDPAGRRLLYRNWSRLIEVSIATGRKRVIATDARQVAAHWLRDGGVAYVDRDKALRELRADGTERLRIRLPGDAWESLAVAPDGNRVLYTSRCDVWLANVETGARRRLARVSYATYSDSWSPNGRYVALATGYWDRCDGDPYSFDRYHSGTAILDLHGRVLDWLGTHLVEWGDDSSFLLTCCGVTGTEADGYQPLVVSDLRAKRDSVLLESASTGLATAAGRRLVFGTFDNAEAVHHAYGSMLPRVYLGRIDLAR